MLSVEAQALGDRRGLFPSSCGVPPCPLLPTELNPSLLRAQMCFSGHFPGQPNRACDRGWEVWGPLKPRTGQNPVYFSKILLVLRLYVQKAFGVACLTLLQHLLGLGFWELDEHVPEADHGLA